MSEFIKILQTRNIERKDSLPLWKLQLSDEEFNQLKVSFSLYDQPTRISPIDCALYFSEWWKRCYSGGKPSKEIIFQSLGSSIAKILDYQEFYKKAKTGAEMLGVKWLKKQNVLFFRTLLLQGGLPIQHISENQGNYKNFLLAVLEEQPDSIEDFMFQPQITNHLPPSSRNDVIYENCLEIVKSILNDETTYDELLNSNVNVKKIAEELKIRKYQLKSKPRISKSQNFWLLNFDSNQAQLSLRLGLADIYSKESLEHIFGFEILEKNYQFFVNDQLVCTFYKLLSGNFKTEWNNHFSQTWSKEILTPICYVIANNEKIEVKDFITHIPNFSEPSLWVPFSDNAWRSIKGNSTNSKTAAVLFPENWQSKASPDDVCIFDDVYKWLNFEGEIQLNTNFLEKKFRSDVASFDWMIVSQTPDWIKKSNIPVTRSLPTVIVYDDHNQIVKSTDYNLFIKCKSDNQWIDIKEVKNIDLGYNEIKIIKENVIAYDYFFNIGNLRVDFRNQKISTAEILLSNNSFSFEIKENNLLQVKTISSNQVFQLQVLTHYNKIPEDISVQLKKNSGKSLYFDLVSPFLGTTLIDKDGNILLEGTELTFNNLHGIRILSESNESVMIRLKNVLRPEVVISKELKLKTQPIISLRDELLRLYYLADAMNHENRVSIELIKNNEVKQYYLKGFTHFLDIKEQSDLKVTLYNSQEDLSLYAIPLNCSSSNISLIPLQKEEDFYIIPKAWYTSQFIIVSSYETERHLMPRFINIDSEYKWVDKLDRIESYHQKLLDSDISSETWKKLLEYFKICINQRIPFSTFDQIRAISRSSEVAAKTFFFLGIHQSSSEEFIQKIIPDLEKDLGFCFHWIDREDWGKAIELASNFIGLAYYANVVELLSKYMSYNDMEQVFQYFNNKIITTQSIYYPYIYEVRASLGEKVLKELPGLTPKINAYYNLPKNEYGKFLLLIKAPIAVAESILNIKSEFPIWGGNDFREQIRRNIQYAQYLSPEFYNRVILQVLSQN